MANEAILRNRTRPPIDMIVYDNEAIEKGTLLVLSGDRTSSKSTAASTGTAFGGIAHREKISGDGRTRLAAHFSGIWDMTVNASDTVTKGAKVTISGQNLIRNATEAEIAAGASYGEALEAGAVNEVIQVDVDRR